MITEQAVLKVLSMVKDPEIHRDLVSLNMIRDLRVEGANVSFEVVLTTRHAANASALEQAIRAQGGACMIVELDLVSLSEDPLRATVVDHRRRQEAQPAVVVLVVVPVPLQLK